MAAYTSYPGVRKLQEYLEANKSVIGYTKSLKEADGTFDGKYGPDTNEAFWAWMAKLPEGSDLTSLVGPVLTADDYAQIVVAQREFGLQPSSPKPSGGGGTTVAAGPTPKAEEGWPVWKWLLLGAGVAAAGLTAYALVKRAKKSEAAEAAAGMGCACGLGRKHG